MPSPSLRLLPKRSPFICNQCLRQRRQISTTFLKSKEEAREQWAHWATQIRKGDRKSMLQILEERGYIHAIAGERSALDKLLTEKRVGVYCGVDPTSSSLHVGHLLPFMALFWMHLHGFHTVSLLGGSTAKVGDPTGRTTDRKYLTSTERKANIVTMHYQIKKIWLNVEKVGAKYGYKWEKYWHRELENNNSWWNSTPFTDVLRYMGTGFRLGPMLSRDTVKTKMASGDGMSFSEFCYPIMQAWDWWHMYCTKKVQLQIGGADQFGNIVAGIDAVKYCARTHPDPDIREEGGPTPLNMPYGFTVPLLTTAAGEKFGKSAGNAIWLDSNMTNLFDLYGFFVRTPDSEVERYLKLFTFMPLPQISTIMTEHILDPSKRVAQHLLAYEFVELVHGATAAKDAESQHRKLFAQRGQPTTLASLLTSEPTSDPAITPTKPNRLSTNQHPTLREIATFSSNKLNPFAPHLPLSSTHLTLPVSLIQNQSIAKVLHSAGLVTSRSEGHRLAQAQGAYIGHRGGGAQMGDAVSFMPAKLHDPAQTWAHVIRDHASGSMERGEGEEGLLILRVGKTRVRIVRVVSDALFATLDEDPPGWSERQAEMAAERAREDTNVPRRLNEDKMGAKQQRVENDEFEAPRPTRRDAEDARQRGREVAETYLQKTHGYAKLTDEQVQVARKLKYGVLQEERRGMREEELEERRGDMARERNAIVRNRERARRAGN